MNIVLLVVDSLRAQSLGAGTATARTPFLDDLAHQTISFRRAYASECWTLPAHCSIFTGLLPSEHRAHFQTMAYSRSAPTVAEILASAGVHTEVVTRNFIFDGTIPGITRGFGARSSPLADVRRLSPFALLLALAKPRFRRLVSDSGFFHPLQRENRRFLRTFAQTLMPADQRALAYTLEQMHGRRRAGKPYFIFCNLYDVHAPYPPMPDSLLRSFRSPNGCLENLFFPTVLSNLGAHRYLRDGFHLSARSSKMLLGRYLSAIELMDRKLAEFYTAARRAGLLDDTMLIITSDHGEAFGEHALYLHDASVYDTHLHVPLWIHHPDVPTAVVNDVVSTRDLFGLMQTVGLGKPLGNTLLDSTYRAAHPIAVAEHFYYPHGDVLPQYRQNLAAAIAGTHKVIARRDGLLRYDLSRDPDELAAEGGTLADFASACQRDGISAVAVRAAVRHLQRYGGSGASSSLKSPAPCFDRLSMSGSPPRIQ